MNAHILIVDDERALCEMIRAFLTQAGYATATAGSCAEALTVFRAEHRPGSAGPGIARCDAARYERFRHLPRDPSRSLFSHYHAHR